jgi:signal transduction histidine kinase
LRPLLAIHLASSDIQNECPAFLAHGGEMGALIRAFPWHKSSLGLPSEWPASLQAAVGILLSARHPAFLFWGPRLICFYNDAYRGELLPQKHPQMLGASALAFWDAEWPAVEPLIRQVMAGRDVSSQDQASFPLFQHLEEDNVRALYSFGPIAQADMPGGIGGVLVQRTDITRQLAPQRSGARALREDTDPEMLVYRMGDRQRLLKDRRSMLALASETFATILQFDRISFFTVKAGTALQWLESRASERLTPRAGFLPIDEIGPTLLEGLRNGRPVHVLDCVREFSLGGSRLTTARVASLVSLPYMQDGSCAGGVFLESATFRKLGSREAALAQRIAATTWSNVEISASAAAVAESEARLKFLDSWAQATHSCASIRDAGSLTAAAICSYLKASSCLVVEFAGATSKLQVFEGSIVGPPHESHTHYELDVGLRVRTRFELGREFIVRDAETDLEGHVEAAVFVRNGIKACIGLPRTRPDGGVEALMVCHHVPREWSSRDIALVALVAERFWVLLDRIRFHQQLLTADRRKDEFVATLAHELRNPLGAQRSAAQIIRLTANDNARLLQAAALVDRQVNHMMSIVNDLLDASRLSRGLINLTRVPIDLRDAVRDAIEQTRPFLESKHQTLSADLPDSVMQVSGDAVRLVQIIANLITNAAKYSSPGLRIWVTGVLADDACKVLVRDEGNGISPELLPSIFDLYKQGDTSKESIDGGLGLGLSLVKQLVLLHEGSVEALSEGPGHGAQFIVRLPKTTPPSAKPR